MELTTNTKICMDILGAKVDMEVHNMATLPRRKVVVIEVNEDKHNVESGVCRGKGILE